MSDTEKQSLGASNDKTEDPAVNLLIEGLDSVILTETEGCDDFQKTYLLGLECPYNWKLSDIKISNQDFTISNHIVLKDVRCKLSELNDENVDFYNSHWNRLTLKLLLVYLLTNSGEYLEAFECLEECDKILQELENEHCKQPLFTKIKDSLWHVNIASRIYTLLKSRNGNNQTVQELLAKISCFAEMTDVQKAGIYGIKTRMLYQFAHNGDVLALESAKMARDLDPEMAEWWFLVGKSMGKIRRILGRMECVDEEEIKSLEKAVELQASTSYIVFLARTYGESSYRAFRKFQNQVDLKTHDLGRHIDSLNEKALNTFMQVLDGRKICPRVMSSCAAGLLRLPGRYKRRQLAEELVTQALALAPEHAGSHLVAGRLYYNNTPGRDSNKVLEHYEKSSHIGNYRASMDLLRLRSEMNPTYDPYDDIMKLIEKYNTEEQKILLTRELGSYFLFRKRDIFKAIEFYTKVIKKDVVSILKAGFIASLSHDMNANLLKVAVDEARLVLQNTASLSKEDQMQIRKFVIEVGRIAPELLESEPEPGQVEQILEASRIRMAPEFSTRYSNRGRGNMGATSHRRNYRSSYNRTQRNWRSEGNDRSETRRDNDQEQQTNRSDPSSHRENYRGRGSYNNSQCNWRSEGNDRSETRRDNDQEQQTDRGDPNSHRENYGGRGSYNNSQRNWRSEGNDRSETSSRSRPNDNRENHQK